MAISPYAWYIAMHSEHGIRGPAFFTDFSHFPFAVCWVLTAFWLRQSSYARFSSATLSMLEYCSMVFLCIPSNNSVNASRLRSISESRPLTKSCHGGRFLNAVIAKLSERVNATKDKPCFEAGLKRLLPTRWMTTPSLTVRPCALFTVSAKPGTRGNWVRVLRVPSFNAVFGSIGTHVGSSE